MEQRTHPDSAKRSVSPMSSVMLTELSEVAEGTIRRASQDQHGQTHKGRTHLFS